MTRFDGWETQLYGDVMALPTKDELMHFRTKGSKNGVRRYQTESGEWTPLGLKERKAREGWGQSRAERRAAKLSRKLERRENRRARVAAAKEAFRAKRQKNSLKGLSDEELRKKIDRLKLEKEYKELNKNPVVETGAKLVKAYFDHKDAKLKRESEKANLIVRQQEALAKLRNAQAARTAARNDLVDNIIGGKGRMKAKADLLQSKRKNTVRGALGEAVGNVIKKEGSRIVKEMGDQSLVMRGGRFAKKAAVGTAKAARNRAVDIYVGAKSGYQQGLKEGEKVRDEKFRNLDEYDRKTRKRLGL